MKKLFKQFIAQRDVYSFAHSSAAVFLANTWNLLPESNHINKLMIE